MKKVIIGISATVLVVAAIFLIACQNESEKNNERLLNDMLLIENALKSGDFEICNEISFSGKYELFFNELSKITSEMITHSNFEQEESFLKNTLFDDEFDFNIENYPLIIEAMERYPYNEGYDFSQVENIIFQSFTNSLQNNIESPIVVTQYYIEQIDMLNIDLVIQSHIISALEFWQDLFIFSDLVFYSQTTSGSFEDWEICVENCQRDTYAGYTWINWIFCLANPPACIFEVALSCAWKCSGSQSSGSSSSN